MGLSLGCGGSSARSKGKSDSFFDTRTEKGVRASKFIDDFKNFLQGKQDSSTKSQRSDSVKPQKFFNDLSKNNADANVSEVEIYPILNMYVSLC